MGKAHALLESLSEGADSGETNNNDDRCLVRTHRCRYPVGEHADRSRPLDSNQTPHCSTIAQAAGGGPLYTGE